MAGTVPALMLNSRVWRYCVTGLLTVGVLPWLTEQPTHEALAALVAATALAT